MRRLRMLDLCSGLGGASQAMIDRGWNVTRVDIDENLETTVVADIREWSWVGDDLDLIWASPPCREFSRESMPWSRTGTEPDMSIVMACRRIVEESAPRFWVLENVRGAVPYFEPDFGQPRQVIGAFFLWGFFPAIAIGELQYRPKETYASSQKLQRAKIPYELSFALALAVEAQEALL